MFIAALCTIAKTQKQPRSPLTHEWTETTWCTYTVGYCSTVKKNEMMPFATTWMTWRLSY